MSQEDAKDPDRKKSLRLYASHVFKQSSVSVVAGIASTGSIPRKVFRALVFIIFTTGFLYQCIKFLLYVLQYPTIVTVDIRRPTSYLHPAFTFCNYNRIKRSKFCSMYPDQCIEPTTEFCNKYPFYCLEEEPVPVEESYQANPIVDSAILEKLSHDPKVLLHHYESSSSNHEDPEGPTFRYSEDRYLLPLPHACFSLFNRIDNHLDPVERKVGLAYQDNFIYMKFDPEENEKFNPHAPSGVLFSIHSQYESVSPFDGGIFLRPGYMYKILLEIEEEKLLPYPYKSNCLNYTEKWLKNNKTGPRSQQGCETRCNNDYVLANFNCCLADGLSSKTRRICTLADYLSDDTNYMEDTEEEYANCYKECRDDCLKQRFIYKVEKREITPHVINGTIDEESRNIMVKIEVEEAEIRTLEYRPQYQEVEAFSYIGGFIGIWLGISLVQVADFLESTFRILGYFLRRGSTCANRCCCRV